MLSFGRGAPYLEKKSRVPTVGEGLRARRFGPVRRAAHSHGENSIIGLKKVFENPEFKTHEAVVSMLGELERFEDYVEAVEKYLARDLEIFIGSENPFFENTEYSMISARINNNIIAVLGPMRMDYKINLSLLERI